MISPENHFSGKVALVSQMRAGTHYMCAALRLGLEAELLRPADGGIYKPMDDAKILGELHAGNEFNLPAPRPGNSIYFSHYYHPHHHTLPPMRHIFLIGFPLDSFYSDGVVYSDAGYSAGPSNSREHARGYVFRYGSKEWKFLEERMHQNSLWLNEIGENGENMIVRYEDVSDSFENTVARMEHRLGGFYQPIPRPVVNRERTYWTRAFASRFDPAALTALREIFGPSLRRFYPECVDGLELA
jgi:hypothetical protein